MDVKQTVARIKFPLWHFRSWLCDKGWVPCSDCYQNREADSIKLGEVADIIWEYYQSNSIDRRADEELALNTLVEIKKVVEA